MQKTQSNRVCSSWKANLCLTSATTLLRATGARNFLSGKQMDMEREAERDPLLSGFSQTNKQLSDTRNKKRQGNLSQDKTRSNSVYSGSSISSPQNMSKGNGVRTTLSINPTAALVLFTC